MKKLVIVQAGCFSSGKTTTTKAFAIGEPEEHRIEVDLPGQKGIKTRKVHWTRYDNCAVAGNHHSGTDSNNGPEVVRYALNECLKISDIAIIDGAIVSPRWPDFISEWAEQHQDYQVQVVLVYWDLSIEVQRQRLARRRGESQEELDWNRFEANYISKRRTVEKLVEEHFPERCKVPYELLTIKDYHSTANVVEYLDFCVCNFFGDCEDEI